MEVKKNISARNDIPVSNSFNVFFENNMYDLHIVLYYINKHQVKIIIRRLDDENGWDSKFYIKIYELLDSNEFLKNNFKNYDIINVPESKENYYTMTYLVKIDLIPTKLDYKQIIPKKLIQTSRSASNLSILHYNSIMTFLELNPEYEYEFFEDADCRNFIQNNFDKSILEAYDTLIPNAFKADLFRYCYLYKNGGVYTDCKMILRLPFRKWIPKNEDYILVEDAGNKQFYNAVMGLKAKNNAVYSAILKIKDNTIDYVYGFKCLEYTGPALLYKYFNNYVSPLKHVIINGDHVNNYLNTPVIRKSDKKIILNKFYKGYYANMTTNHYSFNCSNNIIYYENKVNIEHYTIYIYPSSYNEKFDFIINGTKIITLRKDLQTGWSQDLKIKLIDNKNKTEKIINIGSSQKNIKEFYIF
jgi:mannosyltransferase OCH1-like enzyme